MICSLFPFVRVWVATLYCLATVMMGFAHAAPVTPDRDVARYVLPGTSLDDFCEEAGDHEGWAAHCLACQLGKVVLAGSGPQVAGRLTAPRLVHWSVQDAVHGAPMSHAPPSTRGPPRTL